MKWITNNIALFIKWLNFSSPIGDLVLRLWVADVFWQAGLVKIQSMDTTLMLFANEYKVPMLTPACAAYLGTGIELLFPLLLALGLLGRFSAGILFFYNIVAVISCPSLTSAAIEWHIVWGLMLLVSLLRGPGKLSIDYFIWKMVTNRYLI